MMERINSAVSGIPFICIALGASGSGKTYTLTGKAISKFESDDDYGLIGRTLSHCLHRINFGELLNVTATEITPSGVVDVFSKKCSQINSSNGQQAHRGIKRKSDILSTISALRNGRSTSKTLLNDFSSRSHLVVKISLNDINGSRTIITFVDLAGYEPSCSAEGNVSNFINQSLLSLQRVLMGLMRNADKPSYRSSPLTKMLKEFFVGTCKIVLLATISVKTSSLRGNLNTLRSVALFTGRKKINDGNKSKY